MCVATFIRYSISASTFEINGRYVGRCYLKTLIITPDKNLGLLDDWLRRERFVFVGWSGGLLLPTAYLALGGGITFVSSYYSHFIGSCFPEGCNILTVAVTTPTNAVGHSLLSLWGPECMLSTDRWFALGGLWLFVALHGTLALVGFMLRHTYCLSKGWASLYRRSTTGLEEDASTLVEFGAYSLD